MRKITADNDFLIVDEIYTELATQTNIISPKTGKPIGTGVMYEDHPFRGYVIEASPYFFNGGFRYNSEIKKGDIVYLSESAVSKGTDSIFLGGVQYRVIRHGAVIGHVTPTVEETKELKFARNVATAPAKKKELKN